MEFGKYVLVGMVFAGLFFVAAAYALYWAQKNGQLSNFEEGAQSIFDEDEPLGQQTDNFPVSKKKRKS